MRQSKATFASVKTGQPVATKSYDDFKQPYLQVSTPASRQYPAMGPKATSANFRSSSMSDMNITKEGNTLYVDNTTGGDVCGLLDKFTAGDVVALYESAGGEEDILAGVYHLGRAEGNRIPLINNQFTVSTSYEGEVAVEIIHTARTNQLSASAGSITTHGYPTVAELQTGLQSDDNQLSDAQLADRRAFADLLNAQLANGSGTISADQIPDGVDLQIDGQCIECLEAIEMDGLGGETVEISARSCASFNYVNNPDISQKEGCSTTQITSDCYEGWALVTNTPNKSSGEEAINIWSKGGGIYEREAESVRNELIEPLIPGTEYRFILDYRRVDTNPEYPDDVRYPVDHAYVELSKDAYVNYPGNQPVAKYPSVVTVEGNTSKFLWHGQDIEDSDYNTVTVDFTVDEPSAHLFFSLKSDTDGHRQNFVFRNPRIYSLAEIEGGESQNSFMVSEQEYFEVDPHSGKLILVNDQAPCSPIELNSLQFCENFNNAPYQTLDNVVASSAQTYSDAWRYHGQGYELSGRNDYENGHQGQWRPKTSYAYYSPLTSAEKNYEKGKFPLEVFSWQQPMANNTERWLAASTTEVYSPHGEPLQERNLLGIPSAAKFGYGHSVPYVTAQNATNIELFFESFEYRDAGNRLEDHYYPWNGQGQVVTSQAHSGEAAWQLGEQSALTLNTMSPENFSDGMYVKFWAKATTSADQLASNVKVLHLETSDMYSVRKIAQTGEWQLLEAYVTASDGNFTPQIQYLANSELWLDDIRVQPADAQVNTYVYDPATLRLVATFDDQHFGVYYQYNAEGKLIRKQRETERGKRTLQETHYHTPSE